MSWGDEDPLHVDNSPTCPTCEQPMSRHWLHAHEWECEGCQAEQTEAQEVAPCGARLALAQMLGIPYEQTNAQI